MTRPLELTVHPPAPPKPFSLGSTGTMRVVTPWELERMAEEQRAAGKRFTDAELAAEHWRAAYMVQTRYHAFHPDEHAQWMTWDKQTETLHRFATHPHHTEQDH